MKDGKLDHSWMFKLFSTSIMCYFKYANLFMTNLTIVYPVKMEYGWNFSISGLKMMVKSGLEKIVLKFLHAQAIFY